MIKVQVPCVKDVNTHAIFRHRRKFADARQSNAEEEANPNVVRQVADKAQHG